MYCPTIVTTISNIWKKSKETIHQKYLLTTSEKLPKNGGSNPSDIINQ